MRKSIVTTLVLFALIKVNAQNNNPYSLFGYTTKNEYVLTDKKKLEIRNIDTTAQVFSLYFDNATKRVCLKDKNGVLLMAKEIPNDVIAKWISIDPKASERTSLTPYNFVQNNPMLRIDPDGQLDLEYTKEQLDDKCMTEQDLTRFKSVVDNLSNIVANNDDAMNAIINNTGFTKERILNDLKSGNGPTIKLDDRTAMSGTKTGIYVDPNLIRMFGAIDPNNTSELAIQSLGMAVSLIHEYVHYGDEITNNGNKSGEWNMANGRRVYDFTSGKQNTVILGMQNHKTSVTPERGDAAILLGYGISSTYIQSTNNYEIEKGILPLGTPNSIKIPSSLPQNMQGTNILNTLNIK
jgi:hypothetical protein